MIEIYATDKTGHREKIDDLYWFEEQGVHDWGGDGHHDKYTFEIFISGVLVWKTWKTQNKEPINYVPHTW